MPKTKLIFGLLIIAAMFIAGCTGTKMLADNGQAAAQKDYAKSAQELSDEINFMKNHYPLSPNATIDEYKAWLAGFGDKLALCRQMYNDTLMAADKYLGYLDSSSDEYRNVTATDAAYAGDIEQLDRAYRDHEAYLDTSIKKMAALQDYSDKLNATRAAYDDLSNLAKEAKIDSLDAYASYIDRFKDGATAYETSVDATLEAGDEYAAYLEPGSEEYKALQDTDNALNDSVGQCWDTYNNYKKDYDSKAGANGAIQATLKDYVDKMSTVSAAKTDLDKYRRSAVAMEKLDQGWLEGYRQKIDAFDAACNAAIASGNACKQYLDSSSDDYKAIDKNEKDMKDRMAEYDDNYNSLYNQYRNLHPLDTKTRKSDLTNEVPQK